MMFIRPFAVAAALFIAGMGPCFASEGNATPAEAQERLKAFVEVVKSKGADGAAKFAMSADDPLKCRYKDMVCMLVDVNANKTLAHTAVPKLAGMPLDDDMTDIDGVSITKQLYGPAKLGKVKWDNKYKFARPDTKKVVPRWAFCEKADEARVVCVSTSY